MHFPKYILLIGFLFFNTVLLKAQTTEELYKELDEVLAIKSEQEKLTSLENFIKSILFKNIEVGYKASKNLITLAKNQKDNKVLMNAYNWTGLSYYYLGEMDTAFLYYDSLLTLAEKQNDHLMALKARGNRGLVYEKKGDFIKAFEEYGFANKQAIILKDTSFMASSNGNLGNVSIRLGKYSEALEYLNNALKYFKYSGNKIGEANQYNSLSMVYESINDSVNHEKYLLLAAEIYEQIGAKVQYSTVLINLSALEENRGNNLKALALAEKSLAIKREYNDQIGILPLLLNMSILYNKEKKYEASSGALDEVMSISLKEGDLFHQAEAMIKRAGLYRITGKTEQAYDLLLDYITLREEILGEETQKAVAEFQEKYESENKQLEIDKLTKEKQVSNLIIEKQETNKKILIGIIVGGLLILFILVYAFIQKRKNNIELEARNKEINFQKHIVEEKNKEITDSIVYAKRIQAAILPPQKIVKQYLNESFILYKPKDIVAGDFYWMECLSLTPSKGGGTPFPLGRDGDGLVLFAAADCTGHGVPGALVSVICNNGLNRSVREHRLTDPGKILDKTREIVIQEFEKSEDDVKDGMDIALCSLRLDVEGLKLNKPETIAILQYAGANNPLWIVRNEEIIEIKANKQPIGKYDNLEPYTTHTVELQKNDTIYIFSDGFADQFGGENGKKLKAANFKKLLLSMQNENMTRQKELLDDAFEQWKGELEQLDDVCVIGVRV